MEEDNVKTILIVEDEIHFATLKQKQLQELGFNVILASTGEKAVDLINEKKEINLILMDLELGDGLDGSETSKIILKKMDVPIIFLSNHSEQVFVDKAGKIKSYGYILKNTSITILEASIRSALRLFEAHKKVVENEVHFRSLFEKSPVAIQIMTPDGKISQVNKSFLRMWGLDNEGLNLLIQKYNILDDNRLKELGILNSIKKAFLGDDVTIPPFEYNVLNSTLSLDISYGDMREKIIKCRIFPLRNFNDDLLYIVMMSLDISDRIKAQNKLSEFVNSLEEKVSARTIELQKKNDELEEFNNLFVNREFRIKELKDEIKALNEGLK